jgi:hypothetical protein
VAIRTPIRHVATALEAAAAARIASQSLGLARTNLCPPNAGTPPTSVDSPAGFAPNAGRALFAKVCRSRFKRRTATIGNRFWLPSATVRRGSPGIAHKIPAPYRRHTDADRRRGHRTGSHVRSQAPIDLPGATARIAYVRFTDSGSVSGGLLSVTNEPQLAPPCSSCIVGDNRARKPRPGSEWRKLRTGTGIVSDLQATFKSTYCCRTGVASLFGGDAIERRM